MSKIIDGKAISERVKEQLKSKVEDFYSKHGRKITLAVVMVGNNPASQVYVRNKIRGTEQVGMKSLSYVLPEETTQKELEELILELSSHV